MQADGFAKLDPRTARIGAVAVNHLTARTDHIGKGRGCRKAHQD
jgi:hypothetical protein